jgi:triosephosphate isomerase (TIM)
MFHFIINSKNYKEASGPSAVVLAGIVSELSDEMTGSKSDVRLYLAPPVFSISEISRNYPSLFLLTQHLDMQPPGSTTGHLVPEIAKISGARGSLLNHSEHRIPKEQIEKTVAALRDLGMSSTVCARDASEIGEYAKFKPDFIAIEPPELIGSGHAVSKERPELISDSKSALVAALVEGQTTELLCGAGIVDMTDVRRAVELGSSGILVASGVIKSSNWKDSIRSLADGFLD